MTIAEFPDGGAVITIHNTELPIVEYRGQRVVTLAMIDEVHQRVDGTAARNFRENRQRFIEGADYFLLAKSQNLEIQGLGAEIPNRGLIVLTEQGYLMIVKSLTDDLAWDVQRQLVNRYFRAEPKLAPALPTDFISALEHLLESKRSEKLAIEQRDHAIETKAEIGSRREATAMATASAAVREARQLKERLGMGVIQATIVAVEKALDREFGRSGWRPLKKWCQARGIKASHVIHPTFGSVIAWPAGAWMDVYQIDLADLFGADGDSQ
ncbi:hypothetical protein A7J50_1178 [Pseudomonas antarctica]|uniref:KilA-N DNA-binding domain-containing protein n=1 Tax=Pseudomonas antarctica TaxID=219572 RepID=A0A172YWL2_9PSED|nr:ORF6N domain-containing protein [Pseudomonas antarctica]ANF84617.1 hypothetical protein A7J50_1178 [Pseudomonas antarctica]